MEYVLRRPLHRPGARRVRRRAATIPEFRVMKVHHLNCISTCPMGGKLMDGRSRSMLERGELACHCLLLELADTLVLVDTGLGRRDVADPRSRLSAFFLGLVRPDFRDEMTAYRQV